MQIDALCTLVAFCAFAARPAHLTTVLNKLTLNTATYATSVVNVSPIKAACRAQMYGFLLGLLSGLSCDASAAAHPALVEEEDSAQGEYQLTQTSDDVA